MNKTMKVLYVSTCFNPLVNEGVSTRVNTFLDIFVEKQCDVSMLVLSFPTKIPKIMRCKSSFRNDVKWHIFPLIISGERKYLNFLFPIVRLYIAFLCKLSKYDYIITDFSTGTNLCSLASRYTKLITNYHGDEIDETKFISNFDDNHKQVRYSMLRLKRSMQYQSRSLTISKKLEEAIEEYTGMKLKNNFIFPCCTDPNRFKNIDMAYCNKDKIIIGYFGGLHKWQNIDVIIEIAIRLNKIDPRIKLLLLSNSDLLPYKSVLDKLGDDNYTVKSVASSDIPKEVSKMDASFLLRNNLSLNRVSSPTKITESLAAGVPIIATKYAGDINEMVTTKNTGYILNDCIINEDLIQRLYNYILYIYSNRLLVRKECVQASKKHSVAIYSEEFYNTLVD